MVLFVEQLALDFLRLPMGKYIFLFAHEEISLGLPMGKYFYVYPWVNLYYRYVGMH